MNIVQSTSKTLKNLMNIPNIPDSINGSKEPKLLHISDTPSTHYPFFLRVIERLQPDYLIHTGDLVDDLKLESSPQLLPSYEKRLKRFLESLQRFGVKNIYVVPGNHDNIEILQKFSPTIHLLEEGEDILVEGIPFNLAHHPWNLRGNAYYSLYGHNFYKIPNKKDQFFLNGINNMYVILLHSKKVIPLEYPFGINTDRKMFSRGFGF